MSMNKGSWNENILCGGDLHRGGASVGLGLLCEPYEAVS